MQAFEDLANSTTRVFRCETRGAIYYIPHDARERNLPICAASRSLISLLYLDSQTSNLKAFASLANARRHSGVGRSLAAQHLVLVVRLRGINGTCRKESSRYTPT